MPCEDDDDFMSLLLKVSSPPPSKSLVSCDELDLFLQRATNLQILSSLDSMLAKPPPKLKSRRSSLFYKALCAHVKVEESRMERLKEVAKRLRLDQPNSWYAVNHPQSWFSSRAVPP